MVRLHQIYRSIVQGVAFIPLVVSIVLAVLSLFLTLSPVVRSINSFVYSGGYFEVHTSETARAVLTSILAGMISLTVFGFSMMIVVVNQAASNYSPKVVETLSSQRSNQYILGVNLGTIIFALIVMMHIDNDKADGGIPELAIFANMILAIYCLLLFVRFINNISNSVRINNIIEYIFRKTKRSVLRAQDKERFHSETDTHGWVVHSAGHSGYFQIIRTRPVMEILEKHNARMKVIPLAGSYYLEHEPLFMLDSHLDEQVVSKIRAEFVTYYGETIDENPVYGFRQLREIAVKALSPGINDPGVAILCIEHLGELLSLSVHEQKEYALADGKGQSRLFLNAYDFESLLELSLLPIKLYGSRDYTVLSSLLYSLRQVALCDRAGEGNSPLRKFAQSVVCTARESVKGELERTLLNKRISEINKLSYFDLELLEESPSPSGTPEQTA